MPDSACHWMPNSAALSADDLDDQRLDEDLRAAHVELVDDRAQVVVDRLGRHDDRASWSPSRPGSSRRPPRTCRRRLPAPPASGAPARRSEAPRAACGPRRRARRRVAGQRASAGVVRAPLSAAAGQQRAQRLRDLRRLGVLQVDDEHVAAGPPRRVELRDQRRTRAMRAGIVGAQQDAVRARVGDDRHALLRRRPARRARAARRGRRAAG